MLLFLFFRYKLDTLIRGRTIGLLQFKTKNVSTVKYVYLFLLQMVKWTVGSWSFYDNTQIGQVFVGMSLSLKEIYMFRSDLSTK